MEAASCRQHDCILIKTPFIRIYLHPQPLVPSTSYTAITTVSSTGTPCSLSCFSAYYSAFRFAQNVDTSNSLMGIQYQFVYHGRLHV